MEDLSQDTECHGNTSLSGCLQALKREYIDPVMV